ncbi:MAG: hypothetical protein DWQ34_03640 [Planctomycetota bacterium]|nr:MAG: hypothetical protein DWQ29_04190 [Planctomycetota bacterium]REJ96629.1 MAG: hypothetical protein DWQ34_03640 [Planctomycetota bacterium]
MYRIQGPDGQEGDGWPGGCAGVGGNAEGCGRRERPRVELMVEFPRKQSKAARLYEMRVPGRGGRRDVGLRQAVKMSRVRSKVESLEAGRQNLAR